MQTRPFCHCKVVLYQSFIPSHLVNFNYSKSIEFHLSKFLGMLVVQSETYSLFESVTA
jgi:hypothetical protein